MKVRRLVMIGVMGMILPMVKGSTLHAQQLSDEVVKWTVAHSKVENEAFAVTFDAQIRTGWHVYGTTVPKGGPIPTSIVIEEIIGGELVGDLTPNKKAEIHNDPNFMMEIPWFSVSVTLSQKVKVTEPTSFSIKGYLRYMSCNDQTCLPPKNIKFSITGPDLGL